MNSLAKPCVAVVTKTVIPYSNFQYLSIWYEKIERKKKKRIKCL